MVNKRLFNFEAIERGQQASVIASVVAPYVQDRITAYVQQLAGLYRGGQYTHDQLLGKVAEITALLNMMSHLESDQRSGDIASQKEFQGAKAEQ